MACGSRAGGAEEQPCAGVSGQGLPLPTAPCEHHRSASHACASFFEYPHSLPPSHLPEQCVPQHNAGVSKDASAKEDGLAARRFCGYRGASGQRKADPSWRPAARPCEKRHAFACAADGFGAGGMQSGAGAGYGVSARRVAACSERNSFTSRSICGMRGPRSE